MKTRVSVGAMCIICWIMLLLNFISRCSRTFSDWYIQYIFPSLSGFASRITGIFPFSVGEVLICLAVIVGIPAILAFPLLMIFRKTQRDVIVKIYGVCIGWIMTWLLSVMTLHFFILYQCTPIGEQYYPDAPEVYTAEEIRPVIETMIAETNALAEIVSRDENGCFVLTDDLQAGAKAAMQGLAEDFPQFAGYYPDAKPIHFSYVMSHQSILGIYYPFTMEANYNQDICPVNLPNTVCHEYTHLKGNILEDEANFLAFLACIRSDSPDFQYSGYIQAMEHMLVVAWEIDPEGTLAGQLSEKAWMDLYEFVPAGYWDEEENQLPDVIPEEVVEEVADVVLDTSLKVNGVEDGDLSYGRMVDLVLDYYIHTNSLSSD